MNKTFYTGAITGLMFFSVGCERAVRLPSYISKTKYLNMNYNNQIINQSAFC